MFKSVPSCLPLCSSRPPHTRGLLLLVGLGLVVLLIFVGGLARLALLQVLGRDLVVGLVLAVVLLVCGWQRWGVSSVRGPRERGELTALLLEQLLLVDTRAETSAPAAKGEQVSNTRTL